MRYRELFTVEVLHDYFVSGKARDMLFTPTPACQALMAGAGLIAKSHENHLYVLAPTEDNLKPFRDLPQPDSFSFYVQPIDSNFFQYSNLPLNGASAIRYYFSNQTAAIVDGKNYLHARHPEFNAGNAYSVGQFVRSSGGNCYECLVNLDAATSTLNNTLHWLNLGKVTYADRSHGRTFTGPVATLPVAPAAELVTVEVFGQNPVSLQWDVLAYSDNWVYEKPVATQPISFVNLAEGLYRVRVNGLDHQRFYTPDRLWIDHIGLVHILTSNTVPANYRLLDDGGQFLSPLFSIRMASVSPLWQYVVRTPAVKKIYEDKENGIEFDTPDPLIFRSPRPMRLQEKPYDRMVMEFNSSEPLDPTKKMDIKKLTVPGYANKRAVRKDNTDYLVAEIHLNY